LKRVGGRIWRLVEGGLEVERDRKEGGVNGYQEFAGGALGVGEEFADPDTPRGDPEQ
jgi:hypothetical protein